MMKKKNKGAKIVIIIVIVIILLVSIVAVYKYLQKDKKVEMDLMPNGLSLKETMSYLRFYNLSSHPYINFGSDVVIRKDYDIEKDGVDIYPILNTQMFLPVLNYSIFEEEGLYYDISGRIREILGEYGFNNKNYMTIQWVLDNPKIAYEISDLVERTRYANYPKISPGQYFDIFLKNNKEEKNGLTTFENISYAWAYKLESDIPLFYIDSKTEYIDGTQEMEFRITEETERFIEITNFMFWEYEVETDVEDTLLRGYRNRLEEHGFSKNNYITSQWVIENPIEAYKMIEDTNYNFFWDTPKFQKAYEEYLEELAIIKE